MNVIQLLSIAILPVLFAITVHEVAHGWVALKHGDTTARNLGRLTLNPIKHIDPIGTVLVPAVLLVFIVTTGGGILFGWAKPVPVNMRNLANPRRDMALVAAAGPAANLLMALLWALVMQFGLLITGAAPWVGQPLALMGQVGILVNLFLMVLNLLPVPPLDGGRVLAGVLPPHAARLLYRIEPYGLLVLVALLLVGLLDGLIQIVQVLNDVIQSLFFISVNPSQL